MYILTYATDASGKKNIDRCEISVCNDILTDLGEPFNGSSAP